MNRIRVFEELHRGDELLFLGNAWDVMSALALAKSGFRAIGTTSWGVASARGFADGERIGFEVHLELIRAIASQVSIPVSADIEAGYGADAETVASNVLRLAEAGAAGINIEDSSKEPRALKPMGEQAVLLHAIRSALDANGHDGFFINARADTYLLLEQPLAETIARGQAYAESGASGLFVPGLRDEADIAEVVANVSLPLNVMSLPGLTDAARLQALGVKRFSFGNAFSDAATAYVEAKAAELWRLRNTSVLYDAQ
ncbi:isocitrate lyase/PEP mutase family protein [Paenibacillus methanolicus]|uniref:2-methylisocitrate lyase-like PEP mutase family enzyme n=1 Tax=Paenibacillus methanolicus TaxID=582686 RepID=A0A5S5CI61_9BACL|nr:isocitrate lyase/phosphoenolpyruvate mutase family protein [Paenibacillus methanolicus]TYP78192.1 2-methylisocitrate lyase-like PEP mutase family enzyme [Paenibacillus methanolicus]